MTLIAQSMLLNSNTFANSRVGIIHIDEADKLARRGGGDGGGWGGRDVGGEGVQQGWSLRVSRQHADRTALLRLMEGTTVSLTAKAPPIVSTATGSAAPEYNPNDPMSRGFGLGGKKSVTDGLPSHSGSGGAGPTSELLGKTHADGEALKERHSSSIPPIFYSSCLELLSVSIRSSTPVLAKA